MERTSESNAQLQLYHNPATAARELAIREPDNEEARAERLAEAEVLEEKLKFITENVPVRVQNIMGSNAGAGSGEFHMYRQARRREQTRLARIDEQDKQAHKLAEHQAHREKMETKAASKTDKLRAKRQRKKEKQQSAKRKKSGNGGVDNGPDDGSNSASAIPAAATTDLPDIALD